jgi:dihydrodipicolinate synthase/N-acetylneuraminate lyase
LQRGLVIPASPLALDGQRRLDERRQRALFRYYSAAGAGGIAVGVHTSQFRIRDPKVGLFEPLLALAADECDRLDGRRNEPLYRIAGVCGGTKQALEETAVAAELKFDAAMVSLAAMGEALESELIDHCRRIGEVIPLFGFYLQPAVGGRVLPYSFWRKFCELERVVGIKLAPFNRYQTLEVVRAVAESKRDDIALYTGNDDNIVADLLTPFRLTVDGAVVERRMVGGLLGHWAVWTRSAVRLLERCHAVVASGMGQAGDVLALGPQVTDCNSAFFDSANGYSGCIAGLHEVLRRQGLLESVTLLESEPGLSPGQREEIDRVWRAYPHLHDDAFVEEHRDEWLRG